MRSIFFQSTSNYHARRFGVRAAMPGFIAKRLCPQLIIVPPNFDKYRAVSKEVSQCLSPQTLLLAFCRLDSTPNALNYQDLVLAVETSELFIVSRTCLSVSQLLLSILYNSSKLRKALIVNFQYLSWGIK